MSKKSSETKLDEAWGKLFDKYKIDKKITDEGKYIITAKEIKEFREARLMTKFDFRNTLPKLFKKYKLAILPLTRGDYVISNFEAYHDFEKIKTDVKTVPFPEHILSIEQGNITSESTVINIAQISGIFYDFLGEESQLTVSGRMSSGSFDFNIQKSDSKLLNCSVEKSQMEIDGGFESQNSLILIEAKNTISEDFLIRQLYYPYRLWENRISKIIRPVYMTFLNGIFTLHEYKFAERNLYNSIILERKQSYTFSDSPIQLNDIEDILFSVRVTEESTNIPFPQADSFERVINICEILNDKNEISKDEITENYNFTDRQTGYYTNACLYLMLIEKGKNEQGDIVYYLSDLGKSLFNKNNRERNLKYTELILSHKPFRLTLMDYLKNQVRPERETIVRYMKISNINSVESEDTFKRRASTVISWIEWILGLIDE